MAGNIGRGHTPVADGPTCPLPGRHTCTGGGYLGVGGRTRCRNLIPVRGLGHFLPPTQQETRMCLLFYFFLGLPIRSPEDTALAALGAGRGADQNLGP